MGQTLEQSTEHKLEWLKMQRERRLIGFIQQEKTAGRLAHTPRQSTATRGVLDPTAYQLRKEYEILDVARQIMERRDTRAIVSKPVPKLKIEKAQSPSWKWQPSPSPSTSIPFKPLGYPTFR